MGSIVKEGWVGQHDSFKGAANSNYEVAIASEESRLALNGLTRQCIQDARARSERLRFSSKGVDALGTAKRYLANEKAYGKRDERTRAAERVFEYDVSTGLFEETEEVFSFLVQYPVHDGRVVMGELAWEELAANGLLDDSTEGWYKDRAFVEAREAVLAGSLYEQGELRENDIITISNTATARNAKEYFSGDDLMIRRVGLNTISGMVEVETLKMHAIDNAIIKELFMVLEVSIDEETVKSSEDDSAKYLATQIKVKKNELQNGAADIAFLLDWLATARTKQQHLFGREVGCVEANPYAEISEKSRAKERRRVQAIKDLKRDFIQLARSEDYTKESIQKAYEDARSRVADIEGRDFVESRYGEKAAHQYDKKQAAAERGDWAGTVRAERAMQQDMGSVYICNTVLDSNKTPTTSPDFEVVCQRLPKPGEKATCPCCYRYVIVKGTVENIACSTPNCRLEDRSARRKRLRHEYDMKQQQKKAKRNNKHSKKSQNLIKA